MDCSPGPKEELRRGNGQLLLTELDRCKIFQINTNRLGLVLHQLLEWVFAVLKKLFTDHNTVTEYMS